MVTHIPFNLLTLRQTLYNYVGQSSLRITLTCGQNITGAQSLKILYTKPDGTTGSWTASEGTALTGIIYYDVSLSTEIDVSGVWKLQAYVKFSDGREAYGDIVNQTIMSRAAATITVGTNSWLTKAEADTYFLSRFASAEYWAQEADQVGALITAYKWLVLNPNLTFPTTVSQSMKDAQCEMALFLLQHQPDIDLRMGLQAQGVIEAGIVKEKYAQRASVPIPAVVMALVGSYRGDSPVRIVNIGRDEDEGVDYDAYGNELTEI